MAVVADFEANPVGSQSGLVPPTDQVQFQDLSTGNPDRWLWDFGDGTFSDQQNPSHTFTGVVLDTFTVKLTAWIHDSAPQQGGGSINNQTKLVSPHPGNAAAFAAFQAASYGANVQEASVYLNFNFGTGDPRNYAYLGARFLHTVVSLASMSAADVFYFIEAKVLTSSDIGSWDIDVLGGNMDIQVDGGSVATVPSGGSSSFFPYHDISYKAGTGAFAWRHQPVDVIFSEVGDGLKQGLHVIARIVKYTATSAANIDSEEKVDYVIFGVGPTASFSGAPLSGQDPLTVQLINTSIEAIGLPTTWSWKKRVTGSGAGFVEFSTEKNPIIVLGK